MKLIDHIQESVNPDQPGSNVSQNKMDSVAEFQKKAKDIPGVSKDEIDFLHQFITENYDLLIKNQYNQNLRSVYGSDAMPQSSIQSPRITKQSYYPDLEYKKKGQEPDTKISYTEQITDRDFTHFEN